MNRVLGIDRGCVLLVLLKSVLINEGFFFVLEGVGLRILLGVEWLDGIWWLFNISL